MTPPGEPDPLPGELSFTIKSGLLVKHHSYDGFGRLVRTQSLWSTLKECRNTEPVWSERFFYDGSRRIQAVITDPVLNKTGAMMSGDPGFVEPAGEDGERLVHFNHDRWAYWVLQDAGGDVVGVCDMQGVDPAGGNAARVCGQWRYDAYGAATAAEHLAAFPQLHCGHKALFFDRLDVGVDVNGSEPPRLIPFAHLMVHMRRHV